MSYERLITQKLFESRGLSEATFQSGGSTYKCAFGKYYKDDQQIDRNEYFKAKTASRDAYGDYKQGNMMPEEEIVKTLSPANKKAYEEIETQLQSLSPKDLGKQEYEKTMMAYSNFTNTGDLTQLDYVSKSLARVMGHRIKVDMSDGSSATESKYSHELYKGKVGKLANAKTKKYKDGHVTTFSAGPELDEFVNSIPGEFKKIQTKGNADRGTVVMADESGNTIWINKDGENSKIWCYNEPKHATKKEEPKQEEIPSKEANEEEIADAKKQAAELHALGYRNLKFFTYKGKIRVAKDTSEMDGLEAHGWKEISGKSIGYKPPAKNFAERADELVTNHSVDPNTAVTRYGNQIAIELGDKDMTQNDDLHKRLRRAGFRPQSGAMFRYIGTIE